MDRVELRAKLGRRLDELIAKARRERQMTKPDTSREAIEQDIRWLKDYGYPEKEERLRALLDERDQLRADADALAEGE